MKTIFCFFQIQEHFPTRRYNQPSEHSIDSIVHRLQISIEVFSIFQCLVQN